MKKINLLLLSCVIANPLWAESNVSIETAKNHPEIYLENESILSHKDAEIGLQTDGHFTGEESNRLSASFQTSIDYSNLTDITSYDLQYQFKSENFANTWWAIQLKSTQAKYNALADELVASSNHPDSDANFLREENLQTITSLGIGAGYRFKLLFAFNSSERFFEHINAFLTYNAVNDSTTDRDYLGWGYGADYSLLYRSGNNLYYGFKISYNLAAVVRGAISDEDIQERSLVYDWTNMGLEIGYYY